LYLRGFDLASGADLGANDAPKMVLGRLCKVPRDNNGLCHFEILVKKWKRRKKMLYMAHSVIFWNDVLGGNLMLVAGFSDGKGDAGTEGIETFLPDHAIHDLPKLVASFVDLMPRYF